MSTRRAQFTEVEVRRALKAAKAEGENMSEEQGWVYFIVAVALVAPLSPANSERESVVRISHEIR